MKFFFDNIRSIIALMTIILTFGFLYMVALKQIPHGNEDIVKIASGIVLSGITFVTGYYFGSSKNPNNENKQQ